MAPRARDLQLTAVAGEEERLLGGYDDDSLRRVQVSVTGMTCAACSNSVESALRSLDGVVGASVALLQNRADVSFKSSLLKVCSSSFIFSLESELCFLYLGMRCSICYYFNDLFVLKLYVLRGVFV